MFQFSFLLPTRSRPGLVKRFFQSIVNTAHCLDEIEVILCLDDDDLESQTILSENLSVKKVVLPRGSNMGSLNRACFEASSGRYLILINDDVIIRTKGWDKIILAVYAAFPDDIALIHVNDLLFGDSLCTFPILSRKACLEIGVCPEEYRKYRIDDHICDTYQMLAYLGYRRIIYLADVVFEHDQQIRSHQMPSNQVFKFAESEINLSNKAIVELDKRIFDEKLEERKHGALKLAYLIDQSNFERKQSDYESLLNDINDPYSYRRKDFVKRIRLTEEYLQNKEAFTYDLSIFDGNDEMLNELDKSSRLNGIQESIKKVFFKKMIIWIRSNKTAVRIGKIIIDLLEGMFSRYYDLPRRVRRVFDGLVFKLVRLYRAIQYRISSFEK